MVSRLIDSFETTSAATAGEKQKRTPSSSASSSRRGNNHLWPRQKGGGGRGDAGVSVTLAEVRQDEEEDRVDASAQSTPRGMTSVPAAGQTPMVASTRRTKTAPVASTSGLKRLPPAQQVKSKTTSCLGVGAKGKPEEEGKKREIRARRKTKERARRKRLRNLAADDARARNAGGKPPGKKGSDNDFSAGNAGGTENTDDQQRDREHELPTILRPTAPTTLSSKVAPDDVLTSDAYLVETSGYHQPGQPRQLANSTTPEKIVVEEDEVRGGQAGGEEQSSSICTDDGDDAFEDDIQPQLLQPIASRGDWGGEKGMVPGRQGDSAKNGCIPVDREGSNSDYGDEGFEDETT